ncbi:hypothetical protein [Flavobacterium laiguense]|uniref:DUF4142 domain-containing protein n=1 Tax=Flavobacterium laiguense TaxID=2169409 RepID=A0A2U1JTN4_9FLAO|nr:hypothetical protein [Flavobacterium laiguense]PWA08198.1 hypothetical protein DB891_12400 [Flavobacterium laiguense]
MKKVFLLFVLVVSSTAFAQSTMKEDVDVVQAVYGRSKAELVTQYMALTGVQATDFTKVYDAYEVERKKLGQEKIQLINQYATDYATMTDANADVLTKGALKNNLAYEKLYSTYYEKAKKAVGALNAAKFIQLEIYLQTEIRSSIQNAIPFVGELDMSKVK